tara:strand:- start:63 stop:350 length:288 start_codon:yes stop_codon:yes gene_type:complete
MKSYIQGLLTGGIFTFAFMVFLSNQKPFTKTFKDKLMEVENRVGMLESIMKEKFIIVGTNFQHLENKTNSPVDLEYKFNYLSLINEPYPIKEENK